MTQLKEKTFLFLEHGHQPVISLHDDVCPHAANVTQ